MTGDTIDQRLFFCTTRIEARSADRKRTSIGTGFVVAEQIDEHHHASFIVTCKHVVTGFDVGTISFVTDKDGKPDLGTRCQVTIGDLPKLLFLSSDPTLDVALIRLAPVLEHFSKEG